MSSSSHPWTEYDRKRMKGQEDMIHKLEEELQTMKEREKAFQIHLKLKDNEIKLLKKDIETLIKRKTELILEDKPNMPYPDIISDPLITNEVNQLKKLITERNIQIQTKENEFDSLQTTQAIPNFIETVNRCKKFVTENAELNDYFQNVLENLKYENGLEKSQTDQLLIKIKEKDLVNNEMEYEVNEINNEVNIIKSKII